jgi:hypothetical protein
MGFDQWRAEAARIAAVLCICSTPLFADQLALRCDGYSDDAKDPLSFSVIIDPTTRLVLDMGSGPHVETDQFSDTVITAIDRGAAFTQILIIDRVTGHFDLTWVSSSERSMGRNFQGTCAQAKRQF